MRSTGWKGWRAKWASVAFGHSGGLWTPQQLAHTRTRSVRKLYLNEATCRQLAAASYTHRQSSASCIPLLAGLYFAFARQTHAHTRPHTCTWVRAAKRFTQAQHRNCSTLLPSPANGVGRKEATLCEKVLRCCAAPGTPLRIRRPQCIKVMSDVCIVIHTPTPGRAGPCVAPEGAAPRHP